MQFQSNLISPYIVASVNIDTTINPNNNDPLYYGIQKTFLDLNTANSGLYNPQHSYTELYVDFVLGVGCTENINCTTSSNPSVFIEGYYEDNIDLHNLSFDLTVDQLRINIPQVIVQGIFDDSQIYVDFYPEESLEFDAFGSSFIGAMSEPAYDFNLSSNDSCASSLGLNAFTNQSEMNAAIEAYGSLPILASSLLSDAACQLAFKQTNYNLFT